MRHAGSRRPVTLPDGDNRRVLAIIAKRSRENRAVVFCITTCPMVHDLSVKDVEVIRCRDTIRWIYLISGTTIGEIGNYCRTFAITLARSDVRKCFSSDLNILVWQNSATHLGFVLQVTGDVFATRLWLKRHRSLLLPTLGRVDLAVEKH